MRYHNNCDRRIMQLLTWTLPQSHYQRGSSLLLSALPGHSVLTNDYSNPSRLIINLSWTPSTLAMTLYVCRTSRLAH